MSFVYPIALLALGLVPVAFALKIWADAKGARTIAAFLSPQLRASHRVGNSSAASWTAFALQLAAFAAIVMAVARPQWGFTREESEAEGRDILIALDTSRSMLAQDVVPDRLGRSKLVAQDLVRSLPDDRFGVLAFAGRAFLQAPLTVDHEAIAETLSQIDHEIIPRGGSNLADPLNTAISVFEKSESAEHALVLFTDGDILEGEVVEAAEAAREAGIMVIAVGVGSQSSSLIPDPDNPQPGVFLRDDEGNPVATKLERTSLEQIAQITGGAYLTLNAGSGTESRIADALKTLEASSITKKDNRRPIERFQWFAGTAFVLILLSLIAPLMFAPSTTTQLARPGAASLALSLLILSTPGSEAARRSVSETPARAYSAYSAGDFEKATDYYSDAAADPAAAPTAKDRAMLDFGLGAAAYRAGDLERATTAFSSALLSSDPDLQEQSHYNIGNTLFRKGEAMEQALQAAGAAGENDDSSPPEFSAEDIITQWNDAISHYDSAISINQDNKDAAFNKEIIEKRIEQLQQQQEQQQQQQQGEGEGEGDQEQEGENGEGEGKGDGEGDPSEGSDGQKEGDGDQQDGDGKDNGFENPMEQEGEGGEEEQDNGKGEEGKLEALQKPGQEKPGQEASPGQGERQVNPDTGFSKSQARQLIRTFADEETQTRPPVRLQPESGYKNW